MSEYTKEPWRTEDVEGYSRNRNILDSDGDRIVHANTTENARRIVACVNACAGASTDDLERWAQGQYDKNAFGYMGRLVRMTEQRDQLLALGKNFEIKGPDDDGFVWLVLNGIGTSGKAMFNIGTPEMLGVQVALHLEADRKAAVVAVAEKGEK